VVWSIRAGGMDRPSHHQNHTLLGHSPPASQAGRRVGPALYSFRPLYLLLTESTQSQSRKPTLFCFRCNWLHPPPPITQLANICKVAVLPDRHGWREEANSDDCKKAWPSLAFFSPMEYRLASCQPCPPYLSLLQVAAYTILKSRPKTIMLRERGEGTARIKA
jgi:hypothetical protein